MRRGPSPRRDEVHRAGRPVAGPDDGRAPGAAPPARRGARVSPRDRGTDRPARLARGGGLSVASRAAATPPMLRDLNERTVLEEIRERAPISRAEISRGVGISKPTVSLAL